MDNYSLESAREDIIRLHQEQTAQMNRALALEALLYCVLELLEDDHLAQIAQRFDERLLLKLHQLEPRLQREHLWTQYLDRIEQMLESRRLQHQDKRG